MIPYLAQSDALKVLGRIEGFRKAMEKGEIHPGCADWVVRMCESYIAEAAGYRNRESWERDAQETYAQNRDRC